MIRLKSLLKEQSSNFLETQQSEQQKGGWDGDPIQWAIRNGYAKESYSSGKITFVYSTIKNCINIEHIAKLIFHSYDPAGYENLFGVGTNDTEAVAEAAFEALAKNPGWYENVKRTLKNMIDSDMPTDPYLFCANFMTTSKKYQGSSSPSIDESYKKIQTALKKSNKN
jgi:hypothetical protein